MNRRIIVLVAILSIIMIASGCGSGGGSGRYTIPPEIPTPGTGGGGSGGGGIGETDVNTLILSGWDDFKYGAYSSAINKFNQALTSTSLTDAQRIEAYNGLGWALTKSTGVESGFSAFTQAASVNNESKIGLAAAHIQRGQSTGFLQAVKLLEEVGLHLTSTQFVAKNPIGVSDAEAHAMLAWCYYWTGNSTKALTQINHARSIEAANDSSVSQIFNSLKALDSETFK
jgi:tetratricopeptide (TPR) repeat protein